MALTADQKYLKYLLPMTLEDTPEIETTLAALAQTVVNQMTAQLDSGVTFMQTKLETLTGAPLTTEQIAALRLALARRLNEMIQNVYIS